MLLRQQLTLGKLWEPELFRDTGREREWNGRIETSKQRFGRTIVLLQFLPLYLVRSGILYGSLYTERVYLDSGSTIHKVLYRSIPCPGTGCQQSGQRAQKQTQLLFLTDPIIYETLILLDHKGHTGHP